jgi:hypothetical protein
MAFLFGESPERSPRIKARLNMEAQTGFCICLQLVAYSSYVCIRSKWKKSDKFAQTLKKRSISEKE